MAQDARAGAPPPPQGARDAHAWDLDGTIELNAAVGTTGGRVWGAARRLAAFLAADARAAAGGSREAYFARLAAVADGACVLELGAGCGWLAATLALNVSGGTVAVVCATEREAGMRHLERNLAVNLQRVVGEAKAAKAEQLLAAECDWTRCGECPAMALKAYRPGEGGGALGELGEAPEEEGDAVRPVGSVADHGAPTGFQLRSGALNGDDAHTGVGATLAGDAWDLILGSDLVYDAAGVDALPKLLAGLLRASKRRGCVALYAHTKRRFEAYDADFYENLAAAGLRVREVFAAGEDVGQLRPESPPPLAERIASGELDALFPEKRVAVLEIRLAAPGESVEPYS